MRYVVTVYYRLKSYDAPARAFTLDGSHPGVVVNKAWRNVKRELPKGTRVVQWVFKVQHAEGEKA